MRPNDSNLPHLILIADALGELRDELVFVGGCAAGLLLTDPLAEAIRPTVDVDAIVEAATWVQYHQVEEKLALRGFARDADSSVICRWKHGATGILFDLMPIDAAILGFTNRWYPVALASAQRLALRPNLEIRMVSAPAFIATKLEAFTSRGRSDYSESRDFEDILNVVDGRPELAAELVTAPADLAVYVAEAIGKLLADPRFAETVPGLLDEPDRAEVVLGRLRQIAGVR